MFKIHLLTISTSPPVYLFVHPYGQKQSPFSAAESQIFTYKSYLAGAADVVNNWLHKLP